MLVLDIIKRKSKELKLDINKLISVWESRLIKYEKCNKKQGYLCKDEKCYYCYYRSVACRPYRYCLIGFDPRTIRKGNCVFYDFKAECCGHIVNMSPAYMDKNMKRNKKGTWCPYCAVGSSTICKENANCKLCRNKSFGSHPMSQFIISEKSPWEIFRTTDDKYSFYCYKCDHIFEARISDITLKNSWCSYCCPSPRQLCKEIMDCKVCRDKSIGVHPNSRFILLEKGDSVWEMSANSYYRCNCKCEVCSHVWETQPSAINIGQWCPKCKNKTEKMFAEWFNKKYDYKLKWQKKFDWCIAESKKYYKFDFCIKKLKLIIEIDGPQHFQQIGSWKPPELTQKNDKYKMKCALEHGYSIIRISQEDIYYKKYNWKKDVKQYIKLHDKPSVFYLSSNKELYKDYINLNTVSN